MTSFNNKPQLLTKAEICFRKPNSNFDNCLKGCQWSPDGSCICTNSDDHRLRIFNLPEQFYDASKSIAPIPEAQELQPALELREPQIIYDFCWYPFMNSNDYSTCFLLCCSRDVPIHLWDAYTGAISSSYIAENNVYELVSARSVRFMRNGSKIIAGYEKFLCIFDLSRPGKYGQYVYDLPKGFISCLDTSDRFVVSGSFTRLIGLYDAHNMENIATLLGHKGGVTHLRLSADGTKLFSGARKVKKYIKLFF
ncbi:Sodium/potassium-transporting ATPase subunit beta-2 [Sarcoptes scabiei]|nr:Sodium/potassium-transporting ATPase subunit beta-2 [Sarcoptes scabiei]